MLVTALSTDTRQAVWPGQGPVLLANRDPLVTVYISPADSFDPTGMIIDTLDPLGTIAYDGTIAMYVMTRAGAAVVDSIPYGTAWTASPAQIASQISLSGVNLLAKASQVDSTSMTLAGGASWNAGAGKTYTGLTGIGYEIRFTAATGSAGTNPYGKLSLIWSESASGLVVGQEDWYPPQGQTATPTVIRGTGPTKGDTLQVTLTNNDTVSVTYTLVLVQNSRVYQRDNLIQLGQAAYLPAAIQKPDFSELESLIIAERSKSMATGTTDIVQLPLYAGRAHLFLQTGSGASDGEANCSFSDAIPGASTGIVVDEFTNAQGNLDIEFGMPRAACQITVVNHNAATKTLKWTLTALEY